VRTQIAKLGLCLTFATAIFGGCSGGDSGATLPAEQVPLGKGTVTGKVRLTGKAPEMAMLKNEPCCEGARPIREETVVVDPSSGGLANAIVYVVSGQTATGSPVNLVGTGKGRAPAVLDQKNCQYVPHVMAVQIGQTVTLKSSDDTLHNVHYTAESNPAGNFGFSTVGQSRDVSFSRAEFLKMRCDVHPWMAAHVGVFAHPFFAVTRADGSFAITGLPAGTYKLIVWHERYGNRDLTVTVGDATATTPDVLFESGLK
jgi:plastocyanin